MKSLRTVLMLACLLALAACGSPEPAATPAPEPAAAPAPEPAPAPAAVPPADAPAEGEGWTCPRHLHVRAHEKGRCPECNMFLVEESSLAKPEGAEATQEAGG